VRFFGGFLSSCKSPHGCNFFIIGDSRFGNRLQPGCGSAGANGFGGCNVRIERLQWGERECDGNVLKKCRDGEWEKENCEKSNRICTEADDDAWCMDDDTRDSINGSEDDDVQQGSDNTEDSASDDDSNDTDNDTVERVSRDTAETDTDTDDMEETEVDVNDDTDLWQGAETSDCDGTDQDCFQECWECAIHSICEATLDTTAEAFSLWQAVSNCVVCEACPNSCAALHQADFHNCADTEEINTPDSNCYEEDNEPGEEACYSWAGWGGPCTPWVEACYTNEACWGLQNCMNESWDKANWSSIQEECFENVDGEIEKMFIDQRQCIYCQACDVACASYAGAENCEDYLPLY
jgi:hypothetical protein